MSGIAGLLQNLPTRPLPDNYDSRNGSENVAQSEKGQGNGFDAMLSSLAQNASSDSSTLRMRPVIPRLAGDAMAAADATETPTAVAASDAAGTASPAATSMAAVRNAAVVWSAGKSSDDSAAAAARLKSRAEPLRETTSDSASRGMALIKPAASSASAGTPAPASSADAARVTSKMLASSGQAGAIAAPGEDASMAAIGALDPGQAAAMQNALADVEGANDLSQNNVDLSATAGLAAGPSSPRATAAPVTTTAQIAGASASKGSRADSPVGRRSLPSAPVQHADEAGTTGGAASAAGSTNPSALAALAAIVAPSGSFAVSPSGAPSIGIAAKPGPDAGSGGSAQSLAVTQLQAQIQTRADAGAAASDRAPDLAARSAFITEAGSAGKSIAMKVTEVSSATHFAPVARLSPIQQIADAMSVALPRLSQAFSGSAASGTAGAVSGASEPALTLAQPTAAPVKILNLQLEPASLGTVTVTLNLSAGGLAVQMAASQPSTMNLIENDKQTLSDQLSQSGYSVAAFTVTLSHDGANLANNGPATQDQAGQGPAPGGGQAMSQGGSSNGNNSAQNGGQNALEPGQGRPDSLGLSPDGVASSGSRGSLSGDLYV